MKKGSLAAALLAVVGLLQLGVLASVVWKQETLLSQGEEFRFRLSGNDGGTWVIRDRNVHLSFELEEHSYPLPSPVDTEGQKELYAIIVADDAGFARVDELRYTLATRSCLKVERVKGSLKVDQVRIRVPFRNYYVSEESARRLNTRRTQHRSDPYALYATIRIKDGESTLTGLWTAEGPLR
jgi:uncharacterized membrane-anchored protein